MVNNRVDEGHLVLVTMRLQGSPSGWWSGGGEGGGEGLGLDSCSHRVEPSWWEIVIIIIQSLASVFRTEHVTRWKVHAQSEGDGLAANTTHWMFHHSSLTFDLFELTKIKNPQLKIQKQTKTDLMSVRRRKNKKTSEDLWHQSATELSFRCHCKAAKSDSDTRHINCTTH